MAMTSCNAHKIGLAGSVRFAVDGDGDVGLSSEIVDLVEKKKVEKEMGAEMVSDGGDTSSTSRDFGGSVDDIRGGMAVGAIGLAS
ncbi:hypothetical protein Ahy_A01g003937 isoform A [Arachis hypogaea]|uniref:Uncharacterized protein n=1 Tax=Arachis hypogaea TaxID=3818 RepID=A0A445EUB4_ARAHY|nr:hypothetical protein Ahy_A01g003937 isoform A [Arachis hypogaea]